MSSKKSRKGFTLIEVLVASVVFTLIVGGITRTFFYSLSLAERSLQITLALSEAENQLEVIRNYKYSQISSDYSPDGAIGNIFALEQLNGNGTIYLDDSDPDYLQVDIVVSWQDEMTGNIVGEDKNLNGVLDGGEDSNENDRLDSLVSISTIIANKGI